ncbi:MAG: molybdopterin cofactor-binding domain-containing protein [Spirochaetota bacterium]
MRRHPISHACPVVTALTLHGMLHASTIRAPAHKGAEPKIRDVELPSGYSILRPSDLSGDLQSLRMEGGPPIFAYEKFNYRGEALGLVVGPDMGICDRIASGLEVDFREEDPVLEWESFSSSQIVARRTYAHGDMTPAFNSGLQVERAVYRNDAFDHEYSEPAGAVAAWEYDKLAVYVGTQWPHHVRKNVAMCLSVPLEDISVKPAELGMSFDGKLWYPSLVACQCALAARATGKPVKILYTRKEDYLFTSKQTRSVVNILSASDPDGRLHGLDIRLILNVGAYNPLAEELLSQAESSILGIYDCPAVRIESFAIRTDTVPLGAMGGIGSSHASFSMEAHMNHLAGVHHMTPAEIKTINVKSRRSHAARSGDSETEIPFAKLHGRLEKMSDYRRKFASYELVKKRDPACREGVVRGIALTVGYQKSASFSPIPGISSYAVEAVLDRDLSVTLRSQAFIGSETLKRMWTSTASSILAVPRHNVKLEYQERDAPSASGPLTLSRGASVVNRLVERSCRSIQKKRFRESLPLSAKAIAKASVSQGAAKTGFRSGTTAFDVPSWCGTAVEIEIDTLSGDPIPRMVWMVVDAGRIVDQKTARESLRASALRALSLCVDSSFEPSAKGTEDNFLGTRMKELPRIEIDFIDPERSSAPRGLGELPFITIPAAFYSALTQALGVEPKKLPLRGSEILRLLESP